MPESHVFNLKRDPVDRRDLMLGIGRMAVGTRPKSVDLRSALPAVWNQGDVGSCFAHAGAACQAHQVFKEGGGIITPSRLCLAVTTRHDEGTLHCDNGATLRGTVKAMARYGVPPETLWPYDVSKYFELPPPAVLAQAEKWQALRYYRIPVGRHAPELFRRALAAGFIVMFGAALYDSFESEEVAAAGRVPMPNTATEALLGGHAMAAVGYDADLLVRNSWGPEWGEGGYCRMPDAYFADPDLLWDAWVISLTEIGK